MTHLGNTVKKGFEQQLMLFKGLCIISLLFSADEYIGATRKHHIAFYKRVLLMSPLSEERQYPGLNINMRLLSGSFKENYLKVCERWGDKIKVTDAELVEYQQMIFGNIKSTI